LKRHCKKHEKKTHKEKKTRKGKKTLKGKKSNACSSKVSIFNDPLEIKVEPSDILEIKQETSNLENDQPLGIKDQWGNQATVDSASFKIENDIFFNDIKQEPM